MQLLKYKELLFQQNKNSLLNKYISAYNGSFNLRLNAMCLFM
jgi:hypothetical protein